MAAIREREKLRQELQQRINSGRTQVGRNRLGQFSTPSGLASEILSLALSLLPEDATIRFLEPGFGTGPFYSAFLQQVPRSRIEAAAGYEIDPHYGNPAMELWKGTGLNLHISDFTRAEPPKGEIAKYNLIVSNPPYVRHQHLTQVQKRELQAAVARYLGVAMNGLGGLYTYFMVLSQAWMRRDGVGAWLIPSEFMDVNYGRKVREFLLTGVTLHRIHRFDPKVVQFGDALVSSAVVLFRNARPPANHKPQISFGGSLEKSDVSHFIRVTDLAAIAKWNTIPRSTSSARAPNRGYELAELFTIKRGLATGCNSFFILTREKAGELSLPGEFLKPILPSPRAVTADEILADEAGEPLIPDRRYLLSCDLPEEEVKAKYPALWRYLEWGMKEEVHKRYLCRHRDPWYSQEQRPAAPFLCTYMGRETQKSEAPFRFILNHSTATAANVYLLLYPKQALAVALGEDPERRRAVWKALSLITAQTLVREGRIYGGGLHKLEPKELANVPADEVLKTLEDGGKSMLTAQLKLFAA